MTRFAAVLLAFWAGSLWTVCAIVAPTLFALLPERRLAGELAGRFFLIETAVGVIAGSVLLLLSATGKVMLRDRWWVALAAAAPVASHIVLSPLMDRARIAGDMAQFGILHSIAGLTFAFACLALLVVVWRFNRPAE